MSHAGFIIAAYGATALILGALIGASLLAYRAARRTLDRLEARLPGEGER